MREITYKCMSCHRGVELGKTAVLIYPKFDNRVATHYICMECLKDVLGFLEVTFQE